jgi:hypothetical protein
MATPDSDFSSVLARGLNTVGFAYVDGFLGEPLASYVRQEVCLRINRSVDMHRSSTSRNVVAAPQHARSRRLPPTRRTGRRKERQESPLHAAERARGPDPLRERKGGRVPQHRPVLRDRGPDDPQAQGHGLPRPRMPRMQRGVGPREAGPDVAATRQLEG